MVLLTDWRELKMSEIEKELNDYIKWCKANELEAKQYSSFELYMNNVYAHMHAQSNDK